MENTLRISKRTYGGYASDNYGAHCIQLAVGSLSVWFSYNTIVAIRDGGGDLYVSENCWGSTTGKHLNAIDGGNKKDRLSRDVFCSVVDGILARHGLDL